MALTVAFVTIPPFIVLYPYMPAISIPIGEDGFRLDHILTFLSLYIIIYVLLKRISVVMYGILFLGLIALTITSFAGYYSLSDFIRDYKVMLYNLHERGVGVMFDTEVKKPFYREEELLGAIDYQNSKVRNFATAAAIRNFDEYGSLGMRANIVQSFSIFKYVNAKWRYVHDPRFEDYYASASESIDLMARDGMLKGDCDDYSVLMAACLRAIGSEVNLVKTTVQQSDGSMVGHIYPEMKIGKEKDLENVIYVIKNILFVEESANSPVYYHVDGNGDVWINFDYNDDYPGGKYQSTIRQYVLKV